MMPRSSISKMPLRLANSVGIIDAGYRGNLIAAVDNIDKATVYNVAPDTRLFQICSPDLSVFLKVEVVDVIPGGPTLRGEGGFGSTGK
jgi:dUTP pyrophosphatase